MIRPSTFLAACAVALATAAARADEPGAGAAPVPDVPALADLASRTPVRGLPALVAGDPRFAALDDAGRLAVLGAVRPRVLHAAAASALNFWPSLGVGSLLQGDYRGAAVVAGGEVVGALLLLAAGAVQDGGAIGPDSALLVMGGTAMIVAAVGYGVVRPWVFEGRRQDVLREQLFPPAGPPATARPVAIPPLAPVPSAGNGLAVAFRF